MKLIEMLVGFAVFMILFIGGAAIGGETSGGYTGILGFVLGVAAWFAIASGKMGQLVRPLLGRR